MTRFLRPGGCLFFEAGLIAGVSPVWYHLIGELGLPYHRWFFSERALARLLADCGLRIEQRVCFSLAPVHVAAYGALQVRAAWQSIFGSRSKEGVSIAATGSALTGRLRKMATYLRYGFAGLSRWGGPQTALFIARPAPATFNR